MKLKKDPIKFWIVEKTGRGAIWVEKRCSPDDLELDQHSLSRYIKFNLQNDSNLFNRT